jgi:hypothetical protein
MSPDGRHNSSLDRYAMEFAESDSLAALPPSVRKGYAFPAWAWIA